ncbi:DUF6892 domain-containing protein [Pseudogemmobacter sonorensis]|uniref:DUF6892 domain-containing protein n=1 Tax=Pseudogemmobacter sonorensis TaxID=2989681 RepID=UPI0036834174
MRQEAAQIVPALCRAFPEVGDHVLAGLLALHPEAVDETAALIRFYLVERGQDDAAMMIGFALDMLGFHASRDGFFHRNAAAILTAALRDARDWPQPTLAAFTRRFLLYPPGMLRTDPAQAAAEARSGIAGTQRILAANEYKPYLGISVETQRDRDTALLRRHQADLALIEADFPEWCAGHRRRAVSRVAVSAGTRKALAAMAKALPGAAAEPARALLEEARLWSARPRTCAMPKPSDNRFKDFGLKLLVIEELMYRQRALVPVFDIDAFAAEYEKREISVEGDGYEVIPEARQYFANLAIPEDLLARTTHLHQSSGIDGGPAFMAHFHPFWDPGAGDGVVRVTDKAIKDLDLLPNLARITGLENSAPGPRLLKALARRGVALLPEEGAGDA